MLCGHDESQRGDALAREEADGWRLILEGSTSPFRRLQVQTQVRCWIAGQTMEALPASAVRDKWQSHSWNRGQWMNWQSDEWQDHPWSASQGWNWRRRKTAAERRAQRDRAVGRVFQRLVRWFKSVQAHRGGELTRLAEELLQALERKESWKPAKGEDPPLQAASEADAIGRISLRMEASVVGAKNVPEKHEQSRTVEQMVVDVPVLQASGEIMVIDDSGEVVKNTSQDQLVDVLTPEAEDETLDSPVPQFMKVMLES